MPKTKARILEEALLQAMGSRLASMGFNPRPKGKTFRRPTNTGRGMVRVDCGKGWAHDGVDVLIEASVRIESVEALLGMAKEGATVGAEFGIYTSGIQRRVSLHHEQDIPEVTEQLVGMCREFAEPFIQKFSNLAALFDTLNENGKVAVRIMPLAAYRMADVVALARLLHLDVAAIASEKVQWLQREHPRDVAQFEELIIPVLADEKPGAVK